MPAPFDPTAVRCPVCRAPSGEPCSEVRTCYRDPHRERADAARRRAERVEAERAVEETRAWVAEAKEKVRRAVREWRAAEAVLARAEALAEKYRGNPAGRG
jgi:hypothetical protein